MKPTTSINRCKAAVKSSVLKSKLKGGFAKFSRLKRWLSSITEPRMKNKNIMDKTLELKGYLSQGLIVVVLDIVFACEYEGIQVETSYPVFQNDSSDFS